MLAVCPKWLLQHACVVCCGLHLFLMPAAQPNTWRAAQAEATAYRTQLQTLRAEFGGSNALPVVPFFLFGMGNRTKLLYKNGLLLQAQTGDTLRRWKVQDQLIVPYRYMVVLQTTTGQTIRIQETESGVFITEGSKKTLLHGTSAPVRLPSFNQYKYKLVLRELLHEILINIVDGKPLPNLFVYQNPWRRDGAMMAMCLKATGNLPLITNWVLALDDPYDRNNAGETEADNLGQTLYLLSLFTNKSHPLVHRILQEAKRYEVAEGNSRYIRGRSDFHETPVYQTKWLKFGLRALGLPDPYAIPNVQDDYAALFWWDYKTDYPAGNRDATYATDSLNKYPYIDWAVDHFHGRRRSPISDQDYPLTWETEASQAAYNGMAIIDPVFAQKKTSVPHTWHAAEVFLYLLEFKK